MPNPDPIQQRVEVDLDKAGADEAARGIKNIGDAAEKSGDQGERSAAKLRTREQKLADMRKELMELDRAEGRYQEGLKKTGRESERAKEAARRRQARIERLSRALAINDQNQRRVTESVHRASQVQGEAVGVTDSLTKSIISMGAGLAGPAGAIALMGHFTDTVEAANRALEEQARLARDAALATLDLHALSFRFNPEDEQFVQEQRVLTGRDKQEIGTAFTSFKSATAALSPEAQRTFFREAVAIPAQATAGSILPLSELAAKASAIEDDPVKLRSLIAKLTEQAGEGDPAQTARFVTPLLEPAKLAGLSIEETFGLFAFLSRSQDAQKASTQLRNLLLRFQGDDKTKEVLGQFGVADAPFREQLAALGSAGVDTETLVKLGGLENSAGLASLVSRPEEAEAAIAELETAGSSGDDLFQLFLDDITAKNKNLALARQRSRQEQRVLIEKEKGTAGQEAQLARAVIEQLLVEARERGDLTPFDVEQKLETFDFAIGAGFSPTTAAGFAEGALVAPTLGGLKTAALRAAGGPATFFPSVKRNFFGTPELSDVVEQELAGERELTPGGRTFINNGTIINQAGDPNEDDLVEGRPIN